MGFFPRIYFVCTQFPLALIKFVQFCLLPPNRFLYGTFAAHVLPLGELELPSETTPALTDPEAGF